MVNTPLMADHIRKGEVHLLKELMSKSTEHGMQTFDQALYKLYSDDEITYETALAHADSPNDLRLMIKLGADAIPDPQNLRMRLSVNGTVKQDDTSADMIFSIAEQIATASRIMTLDPGDVLLTGTPAGVGAARKEFLNIGDSVDAEIEGIGKLSVVIQPPITE